MEIKGFSSSVYDNKNFQTVKKIFEENAALSSKNITKTTAPACWEGKPYEVHIETDDGTPVTFLFDVPNKPNESGTPETAWYVPDEQLNEMLNTKLSDLIKDEKFIKAYIDKDNDGNPELSFGGETYRFDNSENGFSYYTGRKLQINENSNENAEYSADFKFQEPADENGAFGILGSYEEIDENDDGVPNLFNFYNKDGNLKIQKHVKDDEVATLYKEWNEKGVLIHQTSDEDNDGIVDSWSKWDDDGNLTYRLKYESDGNDGWIEKESGDDGYNSYGFDGKNWTVTSPEGNKRLIVKRDNLDMDEKIIKYEYDDDMDGIAEYTEEFSWTKKGDKEIRYSDIDMDKDGRPEINTKNTMIVNEDGSKRQESSISTYNIKESIREFFKGLFK